MDNNDRTAEELFNKIRSRFSPVTTKDKDNKDTDQPSEARIFIFPYKSQDGTEHGELTITILSDNSMKFTFSKGLTNSFEPQHEQEWEGFLRNMRKFAKRNMMSFDIRDIQRSNLTPRDLDQASKNLGAFKTGNAPVSESIQWSGTTRTSIQNFGPTRLIVRHSEAVNEEQPGARSRKIESMFVETNEGERFRMPHNRLSLGRAMAQHLAHGGKIYDEAGLHIQEMAEEMNNLAFFVRNTRHRQFEDTETTGMVESAVERYRLLRNGLTRMSRTRGYQEFAEAFQPEASIEEDYDIDALKERFVKKMFDDRLTAALPYVYRAYQQRSVGEDRFVGEFSNWVDHIEEQDVDEAVDSEAMSKLMSEPIKAGNDGIDGVAAISAIIDNEELNDLIAQAAQTRGPDADIRKIVDDWMIENDPEYTSLMPMTNPASVVPDQETMNPAGTGTPTRESLEFIRRLAGLK